MRPAPPSLILLVLALLPAGARAEPPAEQEARVRPHTRPVPPHRRYALPAGTQPVGAPHAVRVKLGRANLALFDVDGNGSFLDRGTDAWTPLDAGLPYLLPVEDVLVLGALRYGLRGFSEKGALRYVADPIDLPPDRLAVLLDLNAHRLANGLVPVLEDPALSRGCQRHAAYMARHGGLSHAEDPSSPAYSREGDEAAQASCICECEGAVRFFWGSFFHRTQLTNPGLRAVGIGVEGRYTVLDGLRSAARVPWSGPALVPAPGSAVHPQAYSAREAPRLHPDQRPLGCPLTLTFPRGTAVTGVEAELRESSARGRPVPFLSSWPGSPANASHPENESSIALAPLRLLGARTRYFVRVRFRRDGVEEVQAWSFATGDAPVRSR